MEFLGFIAIPLHVNRSSNLHKSYSTYIAISFRSFPQARILSSTQLQILKLRLRKANHG